jgi:hypothetical protein
MADTYSKLLGLSDSNTTPQDVKKSKPVENPKNQKKKVHIGVSQQAKKESEKQGSKNTTVDASTLASNHASKQASKLESKLASNNASTLVFSTESIESIRKIVRNPGKEEVLYVRLSKEEKDRLADISYTYKRQGIRTSDNELVRVAINALLEDYKTNGAKSVLATLIASLHV